MNLTRIIFLAAAILLPATWTIAAAGEQAAPAGEKAEKTEKTTKSKKSDSVGGEAKSGASTEKKAEKK
jgi:hypothetical protein